MVEEEIKRFRRPLEKSDLVRMNLPERFWKVKFGEISDELNVDGESLRTVVGGYLENFDRVMAEGHGLLMWGNNGVGKTSAAAVLAMETRRRGKSVFVVTSSEYIESVISKYKFDEYTTIAERAREVDLLVVDDFGKEYRDKRGWTDRMFEDLLRHRSARLRPVIITMNITMDRLCAECDDAGQKSLVQLLKEIVLPVNVVGPDRREEKQRELREVVLGAENT